MYPQSWLGARSAEPACPAEQKSCAVSHDGSNLPKPSYPLQLSRILQDLSARTRPGNQQHAFVQQKATQDARLGRSSLLWMPANSHLMTLCVQGLGFSWHLSACRARRAWESSAMTQEPWSPLGPVLPDHRQDCSWLPSSCFSQSLRMSVA